jgi:hypothetical protein
MAERSPPPPALVQAYRSAIYRVLAEPAFELLVDRYSPRLADWHLRCGVNCSALITADNPGSERLASEENLARHRQLRSALESWTVLEARNFDPQGEWPEERSLLVAGLGEADARALADRWGQNAWLQCGPDAIPRLMLSSRLEPT